MLKFFTKKPHRHRYDLNTPAQCTMHQKYIISNTNTIQIYTWINPHHLLWHCIEGVVHILFKIQIQSKYTPGLTPTIYCGTVKRVWCTYCSKYKYSPNIHLD